MDLYPECERIAIKAEYWLHTILQKNLFFQNNNHGDGKFDWRSIDRTAFFQRANVLNQELKTVLEVYIF